MKIQTKKNLFIKIVFSIVLTICLLLLFIGLYDYLSYRYFTEKQKYNQLRYMETVSYYNIVKRQVKFYNDILNVSDYIKKNDFTHSEINSYDLALAIVKEAYVKKLDPYLVLAIIEVESDFRYNSESIRGAKGLMQIKSDTARYIALKEEINASTSKLKKDPLMNIKLGVAYYSYLLDKFNGNHKYALVAYNLGANKVFSLMSQRINLPKGYYNKVVKKYREITKFYGQKQEDI
ncbi:MAG: lytic transglycosylase domain-containing protein [Calditerrivibrio sp.]|nr:lytic transglycosylase domain-containing protein [Calditerrivibrio sp.]